MTDDFSFKKEKCTETTNGRGPLRPLPPRIIPTKQMYKCIFYDDNNRTYITI